MQTTKLIWLTLFSFSLAGSAYPGDGQSRSPGLARDEAKDRSAWEETIDSAKNVPTPRSDKHTTNVQSAPYGLIALGFLLTTVGAIVALESVFRRAPVGFETENGFYLAEQRRAASGGTFAAGMAALRRASSAPGAVSSAR